MGNTSVMMVNFCTRIFRENYDSCVFDLIILVDPNFFPLADTGTPCRSESIPGGLIYIYHFGKLCVKPSVQ